MRREKLIEATIIALIEARSDDSIAAPTQAAMRRVMYELSRRAAFIELGIEEGSRFVDDCDMLLRGDEERRFATSCFVAGMSRGAAAAIVSADTGPKG